MTMQSRSTGATHLRGMTWDHPRGVGGLRSSNAHLLEHEGVVIEWEARSLLAFGDQHVADFAPDFDVMIIDHPHVPDAVQAKALLPLDGEDGVDVLARESVGRSHESYQYRGRQWALGVDAAAQVSAYRSDRADGAPVYWTDVLDLARQGEVLWPWKPVDAFSTFATLLAQVGAPLAASGSFVERDAAAEAVDFMIELSVVVPEWCKDANPIDVAEALVESDSHSVAVALFGYTNYSRSGFRRAALSYDDIPSFDGRASGSTLGGAGIAVSATTQHPRQAISAAIALAGSGLQSGPYLTGGGQPGNLRAWRSGSANQLTSQFFRNTLRTLEGAWVRPRVTGWPALQLELSHLVRDAVIARSVSSDLLDRLEELPGLHLTEPITPDEGPSHTTEATEGSH